MLIFFYILSSSKLWWKHPTLHVAFIAEASLKIRYECGNSSLSSKIMLGNYWTSCWVEVLSDIYSYILKCLIQKHSLISLNVPLLFLWSKHKWRCYSLSQCTEFAPNPSSHVSCTQSWRDFFQSFAPHAPLIHQSCFWVRRTHFLYSPSTSFPLQVGHG